MKEPDRTRQPTPGVASSAVPGVIGPAWLRWPFDLIRMRSSFSSVSALLGLLAMLAGVLVLLDGLFPLRSRGPNPAWLEVGAGLSIGVTGLLVRRAARRARQRSSPAA